LTDETEFDAIYTIYGEGDNNSLAAGYRLGLHDLRVYGSFDKEKWYDITVLNDGSIYRYTVTEGNWNYRYIKLVTSKFYDTLSEIGFRNTDHFVPVAVVYDEPGMKYPARLLVDEQEKLALEPTYYNNAYFDEIYHPRNAWEIAAGQDMYGTVHPLFGTNIMALFIRIFGLSPLVWRLPGLLFGIALMPLMYLILFALSESTAICTIGTFLLGFDFMHITTSRIGTLEPYSVFFILLQLYFMILYFRTSFYDTDMKKQRILLAACGITMGCAIATKWTAVYSAIGLALIFFTNMADRYREYLLAKKLLDGKEDASIPQLKQARHIADAFDRKLLATGIWCCIFFIVVPLVIYWLSYLPDRCWKGDTWSIMNVWQKNLDMFNYHASLESSHPYESVWYQWLFNIRPIWYHYSGESGGIVHAIACFSNPLLTLSGIPAVLYCVYLAFRKKNDGALIILIGYITALLPWVFVTRSAYAYHFYPTSMFTIMAVAYAGADILKLKHGRDLLELFLGAYLLLFLLFLPVTAGFGAPYEYIKALQWLKTWYWG
ncbi:MAG: phospholipid carrier-dependent glycosyltransferase, partial [Solobacterium sp.]|nr:phospholipid carrier-dependent glycosyltransferase [Solobacterium sp.]